MSFIQMLRDAGIAVDALANATDVDRGTRASGLSVLSQRIDGHVRRLADETAEANMRNNPISQSGGD